MSSVKFNPARCIRTPVYIFLSALVRGKESKSTFSVQNIPRSALPNRFEMTNSEKDVYVDTLVFGKLQGREIR